MKNENRGKSVESWKMI